MKTLFVILMTLFCIIGTGCRANSQKSYADLVLMNASIWTVNTNQPWAEAIAVRGNSILDVGDNSLIKQYIGPDTEVLKLNKELVLPGFIDSHTHFLNGGFSLTEINLREAKSPQEFIQKIEEKAEEMQDGQWILNGNWDHQQFDPPQLPKKEWIDSVSLHNPVCVNRSDGHMVLVNSLALKLAGITRDTASPVGGEIIKDDQSGEPTGILKDSAIDLVFSKIPKPSLEERKVAAMSAFQYANSLGITSTHEMADSVHFDTYYELYKQNEITVRMHIYIPVTEIDSIKEVPSKYSLNDPLLSFGGLKGFVDGSLGSSTALFFEDYIDNPGRKGLLYEHMIPEGIMKTRIEKADRFGLQTAVHAIGDKANSLILDIYESRMRKGLKRDRRWRIEHSQHLIPSDIRRFGQLGIIASVQPMHIHDDGYWAEKKIGYKRAQTTYAFKSLLDNGAILACGSDWPVASLDPLLGIYAAVTRQTGDGQFPNGWIPTQKISLEEAIKGYTLNGAYAEFSEDLKGSLEKGKLADMVVLSQNLFKITPEKIRNSKVNITIFNGKIVYRQK